MRLKSLQIKGFKSFANDTILHFQNNIIGIVGPNGSGKSNIVDAIRWVLGEQKSKELRLESMGDVIFNGTKSKKESGSAMVALTFENTRGILPSEYQFVTISRTLFRSGESEYRLNNIVCRLKDITSLFLDTGIGSNSYAIIALGMVDDILENKENARRRMFEQAAGVSKYKIRKRESLQKLKSTEEDLNRIEDLLFEIEGNLKTLEKQAKRTQKYNEMKLRYKELSIQFAILSIQSLKENYKDAAEKLRTKQDVYRENDTELLKFQAALEKEKKLNLDKELALNEKQKKMNEIVSGIRARENDKVLMQQKVGFTTNAKEVLKKSMEEAEKDTLALQQEVSNLSERIGLEIIQEQKLKNSLEIIKEEFLKKKEVFATVKKDFDERQKQLSELDKNRFEMDKEIAIITNSVESLELEYGRAVEEIKIKEKDFLANQLEYDKLVREINKKTAELRQLEASEEERLGHLEKIEKKLTSVKEKLFATNRIIDSRQNEFDLLKSMIDNFEGYPESIKFLHENWKKNPVILGELLDVDDEYKALIESYLDQYLNYFVVENTSEALAAIELLGKAQRGKANFFILDQLKFSAGESMNEIGLELARKRVKIDERYEQLLDFLLHDCYIFDGDPSDLPLLAESVKFKTILFRQGHVIKTRLTVSGGSVGLFEGKKIGRKKNLEYLTKAIKEKEALRRQLDEEVATISKNISDLRHDQVKLQVQTLSGEINLLNQKFVKMQVQLESYNKYKSDIQEKMTYIKAKIRDFMLNKDQKIASLTEIVKRKNDLGSLEFSEDDEVKILGELVADLSEKLNHENIRLIRHQNLIENLRKENEYKTARIREYMTKLENNKFRLLGEEKSSIDIADEINRIESDLLILYEEKKRYNDSLSESEQSYFQTKNKLNELDDKIKGLQKIQQQLQYEIQSLKDIFTELKFKISGVGERLKIEFNIPVNDVINQEPDPAFTYEFLEEEIEKVKSKISNFGDINPLALEAFNEMNERFQKIVKQKDDIVQAKESLLKTISEIDFTATKQFQEAFTNIRNNFINVFRELFTEDDTCDLLLENPGQPLESDIEIIAKPKGKKPKSISQLSGGEKTLTATALLFALYLLKPAPFCIFDEVDAPLDDANILKFNKIIQKFSKDSQFIIVTHNKSTMVEVDILYGVYMQEQGISAVSAVDFKKIRHAES